MLQQRPGHNGDIAGGGKVPRLIQAGGPQEGGVLHPQLLGPLVHLVNKGFLASGYILRQADGGVVGAGDGGGL